MPLLEVVQTRQVSASIRLTDSTATQVDQYAAFIRASADDVVELGSIEDQTFPPTSPTMHSDADAQAILKNPVPATVLASSTRLLSHAVVPPVGFVVVIRSPALSIATHNDAVGHEMASVALPPRHTPTRMGS